MLNQEVAHKFIAPDFKLQVSHFSNYDNGENYLIFQSYGIL